MNQQAAVAAKVLVFNLFDYLKPKIKGFRFGKLIHQTLTSTSLPIEIRQNKKYRWMTFASSGIQSAISLKQPEEIVLTYAKTMLALFPYLKAEHVLLLGLGGGDFIRYLRQHFPDTMITAVESNPEVIAIAQQYFQLPDSNEYFSIVQNDAQIVITENSESSLATYDVIFTDLYLQNDMPDFMKSEKFYEECEANLSDEGWFISNIVTAKPKTFQKILAILRRVFYQQTVTLVVDKQRNIVVLASKCPIKETPIHELLLKEQWGTVKYDLEFSYVVEKFRRK